jgi:hypothetical protein
MARPKKSALTPEKKAQRKEVKTAAKAEFTASSALSKLPAEKEKRDELFREAEALKTQQQALSGKVSQHRKRMVEVFGLHPQTLAIRKIILDCPDGVYEAVCKQLALLLRDFGRPFQLDMFENLKPGKGPTEDDEPVFDASDAGRPERTDDPGRARRVKGNGESPKAPTEGMPLDEAEEKFTDALKRQNKQVEDEIKASSRGENPLPGAEGQGSYRITH